MRTRAYVDGFDLYHGAVKGILFKWLDSVHLSRLPFSPGDAIVKLLCLTVRMILVHRPISRLP